MYPDHHRLMNTSSHFFESLQFLMLTGGRGVKDTEDTGQTKRIIDTRCHTSTIPDAHFRDEDLFHPWTETSYLPMTIWRFPRISISFDPVNAKPPEASPTSLPSALSCFTFFHSTKQRRQRQRQTHPVRLPQPCHSCGPVSPYRAPPNFQSDRAPSVSAPPPPFSSLLSGIKNDSSSNVWRMELDELHQPVLKDEMTDQEWRPRLIFSRPKKLEQPEW